MSGGMQAGFAEALTAADRKPPPGLRTWNGSDPGQRFAVYRNNVAVSLIEALAVAFPVVRELVGSEFFAGLARAFAMAHPPRSAVMSEYGEDFAAFIEGFAPARSTPYLADVARLERARVRAYHAADAEVMGAAGFAAIAPEELASTRLTLHPSATVLTSPFAIVSLWSAHQELLDIAKVDPDEGEAALVVRPDLDVLVLRLTAGMAAALQAAGRGATLGEVVMLALEADQAFDPAAFFQVLITFGAVSALATGGVR